MYTCFLLLSSQVCSEIEGFSFNTPIVYAIESILGIPPVLDNSPFADAVNMQSTAYQSGRVLSPEYVYILQRKYEELFPGNNLTKPPLLLNPLAVQSTASKNASSTQGEKFQRVDDEVVRDNSLRRVRLTTRGGCSSLVNIDFLEESSSYHWNLTPRADGSISLPLK